MFFMKVNKIKAQEAEIVWFDAILECEHWITCALCVHGEEEIWAVSFLGAFSGASCPSRLFCQWYLLDYEPELWLEGAHCWQMPFRMLSKAAWDHHSLSLVPKLLAHNSSAADCPRRYDLDADDILGQTELVLEQNTPQTIPGTSILCLESDMPLAIFFSLFPSFIFFSAIP